MPLVCVVRRFLLFAMLPLVVGLLAGMPGCRCRGSRPASPSAETRPRILTF